MTFHRHPLKEASTRWMPEASPAFVIDVDPATGAIHVTASGHWDVASIEARYLELEHIVAGLRGRHPIRAFFDLRQLPAQSDAVRESMLDSGLRIFTEADDRVAVVLSSMLLKSIAKPLIRRSRTELFISADAARIWLHAY